MPVIMFKVCSWRDEIREVECDKVTDKSVFINGNRRAIASDCGRYYQTKEKAKEFLLSCCIHKMFNAECEIKRQKDRIEKINKL